MSYIHPLFQPPQGGGGGAMLSYYCFTGRAAPSANKQTQTTNALIRFLPHAITTTKHLLLFYRLNISGPVYERPYLSQTLDLSRQNVSLVAANRIKVNTRGREDTVSLTCRRRVDETQIQNHERQTFLTDMVFFNFSFLFFKEPPSLLRWTSLSSLS